MERYSLGHIKMIMQDIDLRYLFKTKKSRAISQKKNNVIK